MKQKLDVQNLKTGMYVSELDRPWRETPFLFQGFFIESQAEIEQIKRYCQFVFVDPEQEKSLAKPVPTPRSQKIEYEILKRSAQNNRVAKYVDRTTLEQELDTARAMYRESQNLIASIMEDARLGRSLDAEGARQQVQQLAHSIVRNPDALVCLSQLKKRDEYTVLHSLRVCILALSFGRHLGIEENALRDIGLGALLHDVGKAKIPAEILNKPSRLTDVEFKIMKSHVPAGVKILENTKHIPRIAIDVAASHHERYDGTGYIRGLKGEQITDAGMISAIVDCYDAITSDRPYQYGISAHSALQKLYTWRGKDFASTLVEQFIQCMGIYPIGSLVELNTGHVGVVTTINRARYLRPRLTLILDAQKSPYASPRKVDLMEQMRDEKDRSWEIAAVLEPGTYGLNPSTFLPQPANPF